MRTKKDNRDMVRTFKYDELINFRRKYTQLEKIVDKAVEVERIERYTNQENLYKEKKWIRIKRKKEEWVIQ